MHYFTQPYSPFASANFLSVVFPLLIVVILWTIVLKGYALWYAARAGQKWWFIALLVINTLGILEIVYLIWFRPKSSISSPAANESAPTIPSSSAQ